VHGDNPHIDSLNDNLRLAVTATHLANRAYVASCYSYAWYWYGPQRAVTASAASRWSSWMLHVMADDAMAIQRSYDSAGGAVEGVFPAGMNVIARRCLLGFGAA